MPADERVPALALDPAWSLVMTAPSHPADAAVQEALLTLSDGRIGTRGALPGGPASEVPPVTVGGVYTDAPGRRVLLSAADWTAVDDPDSGGGRRVLDLRGGLLWGETADGRRSVRFASIARPGVMGLHVELPPHTTPGAALRPCEDARPSGCTTATASTRGGGVIAAARQTAHHTGACVVVERIAAYAADARRTPSGRSAEQTLAMAVDAGLGQLLAEHRAAWAARWADAAVTIDGDR